MQNLLLKIHKNSQTHILTAELFKKYNNIINYHSPELNNTHYFYYINSQITLKKLYTLMDFLTKKSAKFTIISR